MVETASSLLSYAGKAECEVPPETQGLFNMKLDKVCEAKANECPA